MEHIALYRQFRPMTFDEIVEQKGPVSALRQSVLSGKIGHAYLFSGQRGTGKTSIAKVFSRAINCEHPVNGNPCNKCDICKGIINGSLMDVIEIDAASNNSVDNIRRITEEVNFAPAKASHKVYIIDEVHMLSTGAFNALLKTLEEPPKHVVFLLATTEPHRIPATIHSRCQRYDFKRISIDSIVSRLKYICSKEGFIATDDALSLIASLSDGAMRDAISLLDQSGNSSADKSITRDSVLQITGTVDDAFLGRMAKALIDGDYEAIINMCEELANSGRDITRFAVDLAQYFRDLLVVRMMPDPTKLVKVQTSTLKSMYEICQNVAAETLVAFISKISAMISDLKWTPSVRTTFEITLIQLCGRKVKVEPVPLVVPDFIAKQQAFVNNLTATPVVASVAAPVEAPVTIPSSEPAAVTPAVSSPEEQVTPATNSSVATNEPAIKEPETSENDIISLVAEAASVQNVVAPEANVIMPQTEPLSVTVKEEEKKNAPSIDAMDDMLPPPSEDDMLPPPDIEDINNIPVISTTQEEPPFDMPAPSAIPDIVPPVSSQAEPEVDPEDLPMENQIDLFSLPIHPAPVADEEPVSEYDETIKADDTKVEDEDDEVIPASPLLSMISSSFLDDIDSSKNEPSISTYSEPVDSKPAEPAAPFWEPVASSSERQHPQTALASIMEGIDLVTSKPEPEVSAEPEVRAPGITPDMISAPPTPEPTTTIEAKADLQAIWRSVYSFTATQDYLMYVKLATTTLQTIGNNAYIVFDNSYTTESLKQLTADDLYKKIRNDIMAVLSEIEHVYVATEKQYLKVLKTNGDTKPVLEEAKETNLTAFLNSAKEEGVDLHFGDD